MRYAILDNQHKKIKGYRDLSQEEINLMNKVKEKASEVGDLIGLLEATGEMDGRWLSIGKTDLQRGFMSVIRAITKPEGF